MQWETQMMAAVTQVWYPQEGIGCPHHLLIHSSSGFVARLRGIQGLLIDLVGLKRDKRMCLKQPLGILMDEHLVKIKYYLLQ